MEQSHEDGTVYNSTVIGKNNSIYQRDMQMGEINREEREFTLTERAEDTNEIDV